MITAEMIAAALSAQFEAQDGISGRRYFDGENMSGAAIDGYFDLHGLAAALNAGMSIAPPSDKERLWQAAVAAMQGSYASEYDDLVIVSMAFDIAESAVLEFHKRVARLDAMGWRTEGVE